MPSGIYFGIVTRTDAAGAYVEIDRLSVGFEYGPLDKLSATPALVKGDRVAVGFVEGNADEPIILGRTP